MVTLSYIFLVIGWIISVICYFYKLPISYRDLRKEHGMFFSIIWCVVNIVFELGGSIVVGAVSIIYFTNKSVVALVLTIWFFWKNRKCSNKFQKIVKVLFSMSKNK